MERQFDLFADKTLEERLELAERVIILCAMGEPVAQSLAKQYIELYKGENK